MAGPVPWSRLGRWGAGLSVLLFLIIGTSYLWLRHDFTRPGPNSSAQTIIIPKGLSLPRIAQLLSKSHVITNPSLFLVEARLLGRPVSIRAGEYAIPAHASSASILALLQSGKVIEHKLTVVEGMAAIQLWERLKAEPALNGDVALPEEGSVLPATYSFPRGEERATLLQRMQAAMHHTLEALWAERDPNLPLRSPQEAVILASIIEKESAKKSELPEIAGVYINRLWRGMKLQADPTVIYPVTRGKPLGRRILRSELEALNAYNTYTRIGLPSAPIANPSKLALQAALHPNRTDNLYFVADGNGGSTFSKTLAEHEVKVAHWRKQRP